MQVHGFAAQEAKAPLKPYAYDVNSPDNYDCLIRVVACGLCHSDLHIVDNDWGMTNYPVVPGHEVIGEVLEVGSQVKHLQIGDRVGVGWQRSSCLQCLDCLRGDENLCPEIEPLIVPGLGGFADYLLDEATQNYGFSYWRTGDDAGNARYC